MRRRILHTADLHLDEARDDACDCFRAVINVAIDLKVDLVIIAGDLFDRNKVADELVSFVVGQLRRLPVLAVILPGNHDCLTPGSVYQRTEFREDGDNIRLIGTPRGETLDLPDLGVSLWGKSIDSHDDDVRPLAGLPEPRGKGRWNIAVAHGYYVGSEPPLFPSYHISKEEIVASGWDYIALGHVPVFQCVCREPVPAYYCGSPSLSRTVALVELADETGVQVTSRLL